MDILTGEKIEEEPEPDVIFSTIPLTLVLLFVILFMILCSIIVLFGLYFIGLALFSMVYAILQERVENKYMWALTLIDQMYSEPQQTCEVEVPPTVEAKISLDQPRDEDFEKPRRLLSHQFESQTSVRFRNRFASESQESVSVDRPSSEYRFSVLLTPGETPKPLPPALGALMAFRSSLKNKQLVRSDSSLSKLTQSSKREFGNTPSVSENLTPNEMSLSAPPPWNILDASLASPALTTLGSAQGATSTPSLAGRLAPLSVIAEVSDEDSFLTKHSSKRKGIHQLVRLEAVKSEVGTSSDLKSPSQDSLPDDKFMEELKNVSPK
ncbi:hypothetical protein WR25_14559 [Diploscapter pachys]|uniref:Uncharacterized protein n=1 Tax=Diploscapter pachys TaxID=2018661 RepID=A0A2A2L4U0_9BILA|nr:hypothetical protein WR25_14559 [Diploscapter pachys]